VNERWEPVDADDFGKAKKKRKEDNLSKYGVQINDVWVR